MHHLLPVAGVLVIAFCVLISRYPAERVYSLLASIPLIVFVIASAHEFVSGIQQINHQLLHVAYDSSYVLLLLGLSVILRGVIKRKRVILLAAATCVAGIPLVHLADTTVAQKYAPAALAVASTM